MVVATIGQKGVDGQHVVAHHAVAQRFAAAGIVPGHATDSGARRRRYIDRKPQPVRFQRTVQLVQYDAGAYHATHVFDVEFEDVVEILGVVQNKRVVHRLPALRCAASARQDRHTLFAGDIEGG